MNDNMIRRIVRRVISESINDEKDCIRSVTPQLQSAKQQLNGALRKLAFSMGMETETFKKITEIHNEISSLLESEYM